MAATSPFKYAPGVRFRGAGATVAVATLDRPEVLDALNAELRDDILALANDVRNDDEIRVLVITDGGRGFCSGSDLFQDTPWERELSQNEQLDGMGLGSTPTPLRFTASTSPPSLQSTAWPLRRT